MQIEAPRHPTTGAISAMPDAKILSSAKHALLAECRKRRSPVHYSRWKLVSDETIKLHFDHKREKLERVSGTFRHRRANQKDKTVCVAFGEAHGGKHVAC